MVQSIESRVHLHGLIEEARQVAEALNIDVVDAMMAIQCAKQQELLNQMRNMVQVTVRGTWPPSDWGAARKAGLFPEVSEDDIDGGVNLAELVTENAEQDKVNPDEWLIYPILVETAGTAVQGPDIEVDFGVKVIVRQRRHTDARTGYVAPESAALGNVITRSELGNNDSFSLPVDNLKRFWFDASANTTYFELIMERTKQK